MSSSVSLAYSYPTWGNTPGVIWVLMYLGRYWRLPRKSLNTPEVSISTISTISTILTTCSPAPQTGRLALSAAPVTSRRWMIEWSFMTIRVQQGTISLLADITRGTLGNDNYLSVLKSALSHSKPINLQSSFQALRFIIQRIYKSYVIWTPEAWTIFESIKLIHFQLWMKYIQKNKGLKIHWYHGHTNTRRGADNWYASVLELTELTEIMPTGRHPMRYAGREGEQFNISQAQSMGILWDQHPQ